MNRRLTGLSGVVGAVLIVQSSWSGIRNSAHDFSAASWNTTGEICAPCHTPHHALDTLVPLWNHVTTGGSFNLYASDTLDASVGQPTGPSKACLSCHDGTVALNAFGGAAGNEFIGSGPANLGTDLTDDHPISFVYDSGLASTDGGLFDPAARAVPALSGKTIQDGMLVNNEMHCTSCHDVHNAKGDAPTTSKLLLVDNTGSALCLTCHDK